jgi:hypothetical protein
MLTNSRFLAGVAVGIVAVWAWHKYQSRKSQA